MIHAVLADDEPKDRLKLRQLLEEEFGLVVVGEGPATRETIELVETTKPQLLFLDIESSGMNGFSIGMKIFSRRLAPLPQIIFTSTHEQDPLSKFKIKAVDYLLKPFTRERLEAAVERARKEILEDTHRTSRSGEGVPKVDHYTSRMVIKSQGRIVFIPVSDIRWIGAEKNYVRIVTNTHIDYARQWRVLKRDLTPKYFCGFIVP